MVVVTPIDRHKSVHNLCVIEAFGSVFVFVLVLDFFYFLIVYGYLS